MRTGLFTTTHLYLTTLYVLAFSLNCFSQSGSLDSTFGIDGKVRTPVGNLGDWGKAVAIQNDEKIVVGGYTQNSYTTADFLITRYDVDGNLDQAFGNNGTTITHIENRSIANAMDIQDDGKIILGGASNWHVNLARYTTDGSLDTTFGSGGIVVTDVEGYYSERCESIVIQEDGKILAAGYAQHNSNDWSFLLLIRYNVDGSIDSTFATNGVAIGSQGEAFTAVTQSDGKIVLGGKINNSFALERYTSNGTPDVLFGSNGTVITSIGIYSEGRSLIIRNNDKLLLTGTAAISIGDYRFALAGYNSDGTPDIDFGQTGIVMESFGTYCEGNSAQLQSDGKILLSGYAKDSINRHHFALARYNANGTLDNSFGTNGNTITSFGISNSDAASIAVQSNNKIVLAGYTYDTNNVDIALARYTNEEVLGIKDQTMRLTGCIVYPNPSKGSFCIQLEAELHEGTLNVYNSMGQLVSCIEHLSGREVSVSENRLSSGNYYFELFDGTHIIATDKLKIKNE